MQVLCSLLNFAYDRGLISVNHAQRIGKLSRRQSRKDVIFTAEQIAKLAAVAAADLSRALRWSHLTAMREGDMMALTRSDIEGGWLTYQPSKTLKTTAVTVHLPVFALGPLKELVDELLALPPCEGDLLLYRDDKNGPAPWRRSALDRHWWALRDQVLGMDADYHWHDLRGTAVSDMLAAGCTDAEVAAITGHAIGGKSEIGSYAARTKQLALNAYTRWNDVLGPAPDNVVALRA
jgi:integrase